jgi:beta-lactamase regulating signal transducer with metallopeptidase domain/tetratricopeptide (TPR) repeat protein
MIAFALTSTDTIHWLAILADAAAKGLAVLLLATTATILLRRSSAAVRHMTWTLSIAAIILIPLLSLALPQFQAPLLPDWIRAAGLVLTEPVAVASPRPATIEEPAGAPPTLTADYQVPTMEMPPIGLPQPAPLVVNTHDATAPPAPPVATSAPATHLHWSAWVLLAWLAGAALLLLPLLAGTGIVWRQTRRAQRIVCGHWLGLLDELRRQLGIGRRVVLLRSDRSNIPATCGIFRPRIILPGESDDWSLERRRIVLLHELAHIRRSDCLTQLLARLARVIYWFNPLCWLAGRMLRIEREQACDDLVLSSGQKASDYAQHLLEIASGLKSGMLAGYSSVAMARRSKLESRLLGILDSTRNRRAMTRIGIIIAGVLVVAIAVPLACMTANTERSSGSVCKAMKDVFECTIIVGGDPTSYISLATGQPLVMPIEARNPRDSIEWAARNEALTWSVGDTVGLAGFDMVANPLPSQVWDKPDILGQPGTLNQNLSHAKLGRPALFITGQSSFPATFAFKTRTGRVGLLQLTAYDRESRVLKFRFMSLPGLPLDASGRKFPAFVIFINNKRYGPTNGSSLVPPKGGVTEETGKSTCGHPGAVSQVEWKYLRTTDAGDEYEVTRRFPIDTAPRIEKKTVTYSGKPLTVFEDDIQRVLFLSREDYESITGGKSVVATTRPVTQPQNDNAFFEHIEVLAERPGIKIETSTEAAEAYSKAQAEARRASSKAMHENPTDRQQPEELRLSNWRKGLSAPFPIYEAFVRKYPLTPEGLDAMNLLGVEYVRVGRSEEGLRLLKAAIKLARGMPIENAMHLNICWALMESGQLDAAEERLNEILSVAAPTSLQEWRTYGGTRLMAQEYLGEVAAKRGRLDEADELLKTVGDTAFAEAKKYPSQSDFFASYAGHAYTRRIILLLKRESPHLARARNLAEEFRALFPDYKGPGFTYEAMLTYLNAATQPASKSSVGVYLITGRPKDVPFEKVPLADFTLADEPLISDSDIFDYDWETHTIRLKDQAVADRILKRQGVGDADAFVVVANGQLLYAGMMMSSISSYLPHTPIIHVGYAFEEHQPAQAVRIYPSPWSGAPDPRSDARLKESLQELHLLRSPEPSAGPKEESVLQFAERFLALILAGDKGAGDLMAADFDPQAWRLVVWHSWDDHANEVKAEFQALRTKGSSALDKSTRDSWNHAVVSPIGTGETRARAVVHIGNRSLLLSRENGQWRVAGLLYTGSSLHGLDWLADSPITSPGNAWGDVMCLTFRKHDLAEKPIYVDIDTGKTFAAQNGLATPEWIKANGIDIALGATGPLPPGVRYYRPEGPMCFDLQASSAFTSGLVTPVVSQAILAGRSKGTGHFGGAFIVKTREGTIGLLDAWSTGLKFIPLTQAGMKLALQPLNPHDTACLFLLGTRNPIPPKDAAKHLVATISAPKLDADAASHIVNDMAGMWNLSPVAFRVLRATDREALAVTFPSVRYENNHCYLRAIAIRLSKPADRWLVDDVSALQNEQIEAAIQAFDERHPPAVGWSQRPPDPADCRVAARASVDTCGKRLLLISNRAG